MQNLGRIILFLLLLSAMSFLVFHFWKTETASVGELTAFGGLALLMFLTIYPDKVVEAFGVKVKDKDQPQKDQPQYARGNLESTDTSAVTKKELKLEK